MGFSADIMGGVTFYLKNNFLFLKNIQVISRNNNAGVLIIKNSLNCNSE